MSSKVAIILAGRHLGSASIYTFRRSFVSLTSLPNNPISTPMPEDHGKPGLLDSLLTATGFLTCLPVRHDGRHTLARCVAMFPVVGGGIGLAGALGFIVAQWLGLGPWLSSIAAILVMLVLTRALHEDGLADFADGLCARGDRASKLDIMRDSRIGAFGTIALIMTIGARIAALAELHDGIQVLAALVVAGAFSRSSMAVAMRMMPVARADGLAAEAGEPEFDHTLISLVIATALAVVLLFPWAWIAALAAGSLAAYLVAWIARSTLGGKTGDVLGAIQQAAEVGVLAGVVSVT